MSRVRTVVAVFSVLLALLLATFRVAAVDYERMRSVMAQRFGQPGLASLQDWEAMVQPRAGETDSAKVRRVNDFFNRRTRFSDDTVIWNQGDYWATPLETLGRGAGDCEDYAIGKYFSLLLLGVPDEQMRLIYVQARMGGRGSTFTQAHMVLAYYPAPNAEPLILDNLVGDLQLASRRTDLLPVFSFNRQGLWQGVQGPRGPGGAASLSRWQELLARVKAEGLDGF